MSGQDGVDRDDPFAAIEGPEEIVSSEVLAGLDLLDTDELRQLRERCEAAEEAVSYARRVLQGRLDILRVGLDGHRDPAADALLQALPGILADAGAHTGPLQARATRVRVPQEAEAYAAVIDHVLADQDPRQVGDLPVEELRGVIARLELAEQELSRRRRALFDRIDAVRAELVSRYKDGRADVRSFLA